MKRLLNALIAVVLLAGCVANIKRGKIKHNKITAEEAKEIIDGQKATILDVRTQGEYEKEYIEGALLIPNNELKRLAGNKLPDKDEKILIYCRSGNRSKSASKVLVDMGYTNVHDFGGIMGWPYGTVKGE